MRRLTPYILVITGAVLCLAPFMWTVATALKTKEQVAAEPSALVPRSPRLRMPNGTLAPVNSVITRVTDKNGDDIHAAIVRVAPTQAWWKNFAPFAYPARPARTMAVAIDKVSPVDPAAPVAQMRPGDACRVKLPKFPEPVPAEFIEDRPNGVVHVSLAAGGEKFAAPADLVYVVDPQFVNVKNVWNAFPIPFTRFLLNTYTITITNIIGQLLSCSLVAYGFARFRFRGRRPLFMLLLSTMMLPPQVTMIPVYMIWKTLGLIDTIAPLTVPSYFAQSAFYVFLLRQFFMGIPKELDEAAMIDGCGPLRIWWQIILPLSKPALITVAIFSFVNNWDDFINPLIYLNSLKNYTVSIALRLFQDQYGTEYHMLMAAALLHIIPVVILFFLAQRYFVKGIAMTGLKG